VDSQPAVEAEFDCWGEPYEHWQSAHWPASMSDEDLVNALRSISIIEALEKQALLEQAVPP